MPDILIRGMEMPQNCAVCPFERLPYCLIGNHLNLDAHVTIAYIDGRRKDCPLHELPPHGDLIDRDAVIEDLRKDDTYQNWAFRQMLGKQTVVVPAERRDDP